MECGGDEMRAVFRLAGGNRAGHARRTDSQGDNSSLYLGAALAALVTAGIFAVLIGGMHRQIEDRHTAYLGRHVASAITAYNAVHLQAPITSLEDTDMVYAALVEETGLNIPESRFLEGVTNVKLIDKGQNMIMARYVEPSPEISSAVSETQG